MSIKRLNYQKISGPDCFTPDGVPLAASVAFKYLGGKWLSKDGSGNYDLCAATEDPIGWASVGEFTSNSTAAQDKVPLNVSKDAVFEMPSDATFTEAEGKALMFKVCDIVVNGGIQQADIGSSTYDVLQIVGYNVDAQTVYVRKATALGITAHTGVV